MTKPSWKKLLVAITSLYLLSAIACALHHTLNLPKTAVASDAPTRPVLLTAGTEAPLFQLTSTTDKQVSLADYLHKKRVLIEFFASWCPHCQHSVTPLKMIQKKYAHQLKILAINAGDRPPEASTSKVFQKSFHVSYTILDWPDRSLLDAYHLSSFPTFYLIDKDGKILWAHSGELTPDREIELYVHLKS
jgi:thiol-disulfide isomerase/thioredoxin